MVVVEKDQAPLANASVSRCELMRQHSYIDEVAGEIIQWPCMG